MCVCVIIELGETNKIFYAVKLALATMVRDLMRKHFICSKHCSTSMQTRRSCTTQ